MLKEYASDKLDRRKLVGLRDGGEGGSEERKKHVVGVGRF